MNFLSTGEKIKRARIYKGMTLKELCQKDISISRMSCIENGKVTPERWVLELIAERLELNLEYLLSDDISQINKCITKFTYEKTNFSDKDCEEILSNIEYTIEREYYDLGFKLMHLLFKFYIEYRKFHKIPDILNDYYILSEKNQELVHIYYGDLAKYFMSRCNYRDAITYLNTLAQTFRNKELTDEVKGRLILIKIYKSICYYRVGNILRTEEILGRIYEMVNNERNDLYYVARGISAVINIITGKDYNDDLNEFEKLEKSKKYYCLTKLMIGEAFFEVGNVEAGMKEFKDSEIHTAKVNQMQYVEVLLVECKALIGQRRFTEANEYCDNALQQAIELDNIVYIESGYYLKSLIAKSQGSFIQWEMYMNLAMDLLLKFGTYIEKQERYLEMANMYHVIGETRESLKYLSLSSESQRELY